MSGGQYSPVNSVRGDTFGGGTLFTMTTERNGRVPGTISRNGSDCEWKLVRTCTFNTAAAFSLHAMAKVFKVSAIPLTVSEVLGHLKDPPAEQINSIPPAEPN